MTRDELARRAAAGDEAAALSLADALDAEGRHADAVDALARAAQRGGLTAMARVGARILVGDRAPALPAQGASLIEDAARAGGSEAAAHLAVLAAAGAYRAPSWEEALDWLLRAALAGHAAARGQLVVLSGDGALAAETREQGAGAPSDAWRRLRAAVDPAGLIRAPEAGAETLSDDPRVRRFPGFAAPEACAWLIARAGERLRRAEVYHTERRVAVSDTRTNSTRVFTLADTDLVALALQHRIAAAAGLPFTHLEACAVLHYAPGEEFTEHYDFVDPATPGYAAHIARDGQRRATFLVYLNDGYDGGETAFPRLGLEHRGRAGEGLVFANVTSGEAPDERTLHAGRPPRSGEKWVMSQFIRSRPVVPGA